MWKIRTEVDMATGQQQRWFHYQELDNEGEVLGEVTLPEHVALGLMKDLIRGFPEVVEVLIKEAKSESTYSAEVDRALPEEDDEPLMPQVARSRMPASAPPEEAPSTPLDLNAPSGEGFKLSDLAPHGRGERDAPQG